MSSTSNGREKPSYEPARMEQQVSMVSRPRTMRRTSRQTFGTSWSASNPGTIKRHRYAEPTSPSLTVRNGHSEFRCGLHNAPCSIRVGGSYGNAGRVGNPIPQSAICRVGDRDDVWQARLPLLRCYETAVDPVIDDPHTDAVSLANLFDVECTGGKRRARNAILVSDPSDHADREVFASRACEAIAVQHCDDLSVVERGCQGTDASNERIGITKLFGAVRRQAQLDRFDGAALPANIQSQQLWLLALGDGDIPDQQAEHSLAVTRCGRWSGPKSRKV